MVVASGGSHIMDPLQCVKSVLIQIFPCPYSVRMRENTDRRNSKYGQFSRIFGKGCCESLTHLCSIFQYLTGFAMTKSYLILKKLYPNL